MITMTTTTALLLAGGVTVLFGGVCEARVRYERSRTAMLIANNVLEPVLSMTDLFGTDMTKEQAKSVHDALALQGNKLRDELPDEEPKHILGETAYMIMDSVQIIDYAAIAIKAKVVSLGCMYLRLLVDRAKG